jgi:hypothetical protein
MGIRTKLNPLGGTKSSKNIDYGPFCFRIDTTNPNPTTAVTYQGNNADYTPASMDFTTGTLNYGSWENAFFQPRPVMLKYNGTVDYELDHNDFTKKLDGTASDISKYSYGGNCMIGFPQVWLKFTTSGNYQYVYIAAQKLDSDYRCYSHYNNNGVLLDEIYVAAFEPSDSTQLRSLADKTVLINKSGATMRQYAQANGNGWDFLDLGTLQMIQMLFILMFKSRDSQSKCGGGVVGGTKMTSTGSLKDKPMFYSTNNTSSSNVAVKFFGIENLWGNKNKWINGLTCYQKIIYYKLCNYTADGSTTTGYKPQGNNPGYKEYVGYIGGKVLYNLGIPNASDGIMWYWPYSNLPTTGTNSTYYCDTVVLSSSPSSTNVGCALFGGYYNSGASAGLFNVELNYNHKLNNQSNTLGASLSCKPY